MFFSLSLPCLYLVSSTRSEWNWANSSPRRSRPSSRTPQRSTPMTPPPTGSWTSWRRTLSELILPLTTSTLLHIVIHLISSLHGQEPHRGSWSHPHSRAEALCMFLLSLLISWLLSFLCLYVRCEGKTLFVLEFVKNASLPPHCDEKFSFWNKYLYTMSVSGVKNLQKQQLFIVQIQISVWKTIVHPLVWATRH